MSSPDNFNFGRRIKDLKRSYNKTYAELTAGLKISRERIVQLEENERDPTDIERQRFADFYGLPHEDFGLSGGGEAPQPNAGPSPARPRPTPPPAGNYTPRTGGDFNSRPPQGGNNYQDRPGYNNNNYEPRSGDRFDQGNSDRQSYYNNNNRQGDNRQGDNAGNNRAPGNYQDRPPRQGNFGSGGSNYGDRPSRPPGNFQPGNNNNYGDRPPRPAGDFQNRPPRPPVGGGQPGNNRPPQSEDGERPARPPQAPRPARPPKEKVDKGTGEPKPVMKYTAEQLGDIESAYLRKQRDLKVPLKFTFMNGKEYTGVVVDFTPFTVHIIEHDTGEEVILRKLAMSYYRKADALEEARQSQANGDAEKSEEA